MTGTYEGDVSELDIRAAVRGFWQVLANNMSPAHLDHFWMYVDESKPSQAIGKASKLVRYSVEFHFTTDP